MCRNYIEVFFFCFFFFVLSESIIDAYWRVELVNAQPAA